MNVEKAKEGAQMILDMQPGEDVRAVCVMVETLPWEQVEQILAFIADEDPELREVAQLHKDMWDAYNADELPPELEEVWERQRASLEAGVKRIKKGIQRRRLNVVQGGKPS